MIRYVDWGSGYWIRYKKIENAIVEAPTIDADRPKVVKWIRDSGCWIRYKTFENAINAIAEAPTIDIPQWIPCDERMPEEAHGCLVTVYGEDPYSGEYYQIYHETVGYDGEGWNNADGWTLPYEVIAWMPLPEPYKGDSDETD